MLSTPVIYPSDSVSVYPFNRTLINVDDTRVLTESVEHFLQAGPFATVVTRKIECVLDRETGKPIPNTFPAGNFVLMWALPNGKREAETKGDKYTTNYLASDLLMYENQFRSEWSRDVEIARSGNATRRDLNVVTGPALLFCIDYATKRHVYVDVNLIFLRNMGNWFSASPAPIRPAVTRSVHVVLDSGGGGGGGGGGGNGNDPSPDTGAITSTLVIASANCKDSESDLEEIDLSSRDIEELIVKNNEKAVEKDDAEDPLVRPRSESEPEDATTVKHRKVDVGVLESEHAGVKVYEPFPSSTTTTKASPRKLRTGLPLERRVYQTRGRSGIQKVNSRYAK